MYLHLGNDIVVKTRDIIGIFDLDKSTIKKITRDYLKNSEQKKEVINVSTELPKSFIVCKRDRKNTVYISPISSGTLLKRTEFLKKIVS